MKLAISLSVLFFSGMSLEVRHAKDQEQHQVSDQCCTQSGGTLCGKFFKSCCNNAGCTSSFWS
jgi:hypothetical protein